MEPRPNAGNEQQRQRKKKNLHEDPDKPGPFLPWNLWNRIHNTMMSVFWGCDARLGSRKDEEDHVEMVLVVLVVVVVERNLNGLSSAMTK